MFTANCLSAFRLRCGGALLVAALSWSHPAFAAEPDSTERLLSLMQQGRHVQVIERLKKRLQVGSQQRPEVAQMLLAKNYLETSNHQEAEKLLLAGAKADPEHADLWAYQQVRLYLNWGRRPQALDAVRTVLQSPRRWLYLGKLRSLLDQHFNSPRELTQLKGLLEETLGQPEWLLEEHNLAEKYIKVVEREGGPVPFVVLAAMWQSPDSRRDAEWSHKMMEAQSQRPTAEMTVSRMERLRRLGEMEYLIYHLPDQAKGLPAASRARLGDILLDAYYRERFYTKTLNLREQDYFTQTYEIPEVRQLYWQARMQRRLMKEDAMEKTVRQLEQAYPGSDELGDLLLEISRYYKGSDQDEVASGWWQRLLKQFPKTRGGEIAAWELAWYRYQAKDWDGSLKYINEGLRNGISDPEVAAKFVYWQGKLALQEKQQERAQRIFRNLLNWHPNTYYGMLARRTVPDFLPEKIPYTDKAFWHDNPPEYAPGKEPAELVLAEFLLAAGEGDIGARYLRNVVEWNSPKSLIWESSLLLEEYGEFRTLQTMVANHYLRDLKRQPIGRQRVWSFAFPRPHWEAVEKYSKDAGIDPYLAYAIMREESLFQADVVSPASARGLMQLMPYTGKRVAKILGLKLEDEKELFNPTVNIRLGTSYLGQISKRFEEVIQIAGSYNAGPGRMREWVGRFPDRGLDEFVESIPYIETRNYVKRVYRSYQLYKAFYEAGA